MKAMTLTLCALTIIALAGCDKGVDSPRGFSLPKGDIDAGKAVFLKYQCLACHTLQGVEDPTVEKHPEISISLGGDKTEIVTYAELVTSIINPSHKFSSPRSLMAKDATGKSNMTVFNDQMTITELTNLVTFLQPNYSLVPYRRTSYPRYPLYSRE
ncbi:cytochrome C [Pseudoalteromonas sp.]|uniref:cytochrome C n=1 Tax=Pseudoalteromonas sp. TaxID=53249 RepID=UPI003569C0CF